MRSCAKSVAFLLCLIGSACAKFSEPARPPQAPITSLTVSPANPGETLPPITNDTVAGQVLVAQNVSEMWFDYDDPYSCTQWVRDPNQEDILLFERNFCPQSGGLPASGDVAFTLTLAPDAADSALVKAVDGTTVGELSLDTNTSEVWLEQLCSGNYNTTCVLTFDSLGHWQSIETPDGSKSLSY